MGNILEIDSVQLRFGNRVILNNIYIKSQTGVITGIIGRNGCGKSCLLKMIFGEIQTNEKSVRINGNILFDDDRKPDDVKMMPQFHFLPKHLKVIQAFEFHNINYAEFCELFNEFHTWSHFKISALSSGNIRIVEIYLILKSNAKFCILDEPFSHLSPKNATIFIELIKQEKEKKGIILTDHLFNYISKVSDELYVIRDCVSYKINNFGTMDEYEYLKMLI